MQVRVARLAMSLARKLQRTSVLNTGSLVGEILSRSYSFQSPDETVTPSRVLVLYSFEKTQLRQGDRTIPACSTCCQYIMLMALGVHHVKFSVRKYDYTYQVGQTSRIGEWRYCRSCKEPSLL